MFDLDNQKEQEINRIVTILKQIDLPDILLLTRDANTLLLRQQEVSRQEDILDKKVTTDRKAG
ncbi:hypothetical protein [Blautia producta]|uniref:Uncharacterized protein n=2 Tax=Blautia producta TaxID=33035 RepID=A0A7G5MR36_9FIRM|nr:hypothetical protein [Blautia producta]QIB55069.1 hypothetical protein GXM18_09380 [Blautia producta ATCC 27340 = DSM 2950]QMW77079.1 hypothetical protein E5259_05380 [Blautia producta]